MTDLRLWPDNVGPATFFPGAAKSTVATEFEVTTGQWWLKELRVWRGSWEMIGPVYGRVYEVSSTNTGSPVPGTDVTLNLNGLGWQAATIATPVLLVTGQRYRAVYWTPSGLNATIGYW